MTHSATTIMWWPIITISSLILWNTTSTRTMTRFRKRQRLSITQTLICTWSDTASRKNMIQQKISRVWRSFPTSIKRKFPPSTIKLFKRSTLFHLRLRKPRGVKSKPLNKKSPIQYSNQLKAKLSLETRAINLKVFKSMRKAKSASCN